MLAQGAWILDLQVAFLFLTRGRMPLEPAWREFFAAAALVEPVDVSRLWAPEVIAPRDITAQLAANDKRDAAAVRFSAGRQAVDPREVGSAVIAAAQRAGAGSGSATLGNRQGIDSAPAEGGGVALRRLLRWTSWAGRASGPDSIAAQDLFSVYVHPPPAYRFPARSLFRGREVADRVAVSWAQHSVVRCCKLLQPLCQCRQHAVSVTSHGRSLPRILQNCFPATFRL